MTLTEDAYDVLRLEAAARRLSMAGYAGTLLERALDGGEPGVETRRLAGAPAERPGLGSDVAQAASSPPSSGREIMGAAGGAGSPSPEPAAGSVNVASAFKPDPKTGGKR